LNKYVGNLIKNGKKWFKGKPGKGEQCLPAALPRRQGQRELLQLHRLSGLFSLKRSFAETKKN
jgi:hypothetical protein